VITSEEFHQKIESLLDKKVSKIAVAVSGGADSLCLTFLLNDWAVKQGIELFAFTVDHGLRPESADEASYVHDLLTEKGIRHETLLWVGKKPQTAIEEKARNARYDLLIKACKDKNIQHLCLAHHQNDQAETFLLRLIRSSGVDGLSAMQNKSKREDITLLRPLLDVSRERLQKTLRHHFHIRWIEDPSNNQPIYERVRLRKFQQQLDAVGLTASAIGLSAKRLARAKEALEWITNDFMDKYVQKHLGGFVFVDWKRYSELPLEIRLRVLDKSMAFVVGKQYQSRMAQIEKLLEQMPCRLTLHDCQIVCNKKGFYVCAEYAKLPVEKMLNANETTSWGRFEVLCDKKATVRALGDALKVKNLPALVRKTIPAFFDEKGLAFVPALDYKRENTNINGSIQIKD